MRNILSALESNCKSGKVSRFLLLMGMLLLIVSCAPSSAGSGEHLGLVYYSERDGVSQQGAFYFFDLQTGAERRLTSKNELVIMTDDLLWSPAAQRFVYPSVEDGVSRMCIVDITWQQRQCLEDSSPAQKTDLSWSPDGAQITFVRPLPFPEGGLRSFVINADGSDERQLLGLDEPYFDIDWSPDGSRVALVLTSEQLWPRYDFETDMTVSAPVRDLAVFDFESGEQILRLTEDDHWIPRWSHDGTRLAYISNRGGESRLYVMDMASGRSVRLTLAAEVLYFDWSPDDTQIAFMAGSSGIYDIYVVQSDGTGMVNLTDSPARDIWGTWSPDGQSLVFFSVSKEDGTDAEIYVMEVKTRSVRQVTHNQYYDIFPRWVAWSE